MSKGKQVLFCSLYRPLGGDGEFVDKLSAMLDKAVLEGKEILVLGNVNIDLLPSVGISQSARKLDNIAREYGLTQMIQEDTRVT